jgi:hypothetical protein
MYFLSAYRASSILYQIAVANKGYWIIPDNVCHVVLATLVLADCIPIVLDVDKKSLELNHNYVLQRVKQNNSIRGIIIVRAFGNDKLDYSEFIQNVRKINPTISIVDDRCLCDPMFQKFDSDADYYLYSTGYSKFVDLGFGGFCFSKRKIMTLSLSYSEKDDKDFNNFFSKIINSNLSVNQTDIYNISKKKWLNFKTLDSNYLELVQKKHVTSLEHKNVINKIYLNIRKDLLLGNDFNVWRFNILIDNRQEILNLLFNNGIFCSKHYFPISKLLRQLPNPIWNFYSSHIINLFNDSRCSELMAIKSVEIINKYGRTLK